MTNWSDEKVDVVIGLLLRWGVILAAIVVITGGSWYLLRSGTTTPDYHAFKGEPHELSSIGGVIKGVVVEGRPQAVIQFGLLLLIATPVARVVFSIFAFAAQRDWIYVGVTMIVLSILVYSLSGAGA